MTQLEKGRLILVLTVSGGLQVAAPARADSPAQPPAPSADAANLTPLPAPVIRIVKPTLTLDPTDFDGFVAAPIAGVK